MILLNETAAFHSDGTAPTDADTIFVFGSNLAGVHGAGAARAAKEKFGAKMGKGVGLVGQSYAIPTKDESITTMPISEIEPYIQEFNEFVRLNPGMKFFVTRIGCQLAGYKDEEIAPLFKAYKNCSFAEEWKGLVGKV